MTRAEIAALREKRAGLVAEAGKIISDAQARAEGERDLTDDEQKRFDALHAEADRLKADADAADRRLDAADRQAAAVADLNAARPRLVQPGEPGAGAGGRVTVPAGQRRVGPLRAFRGPDAEGRAYQAGLWVAAVMYGHEASRQRYADAFGPADLRAATMSTTSNANGGYFVPDVLDTSIVKLIEEYGVARRVCHVHPMSSDTWKGPRWTGVLTASFVSEGSASSSSTEPTYDLIELVAKNAVAYGKQTRNLSEDAIVNLGDEWATAAGIAFAKLEDNCLFNGDGSATYGGIYGLLPKLEATSAAQYDAASGNTTPATLDLEDFWGCVGKLRRYPGIEPRWFVHQEVYAASMGRLQTAAGGVTAMDIANGGIPKFLGYPVEIVNVMPAVSAVTAGVIGIVFGDLRMAAMFGDRRGRTFEAGMVNDDFTKQLMTLLFTERFDINVHAVVDPTDSSKAGPVVGLETAAS